MRQKQSVTVEDVAREAGVAAATVSNVLNDRQYVAEETRRRVLEAVEKLGYRRNSLARGLRISRTMSLGLLVPTVDNPFYPSLARGVEDEARRRGYIVLLCNTDRRPENERAFVQALMERRVDGIVAVSPMVPAKKLIPAKASMAVVVVEGSRLDASSCDAVTLEAQSGIEEAAEHLYTLGHRRIGFLRGPEGVPRADERWRLWQEAASKRGMTIAAEHTFAGDFTFESGMRGGLAILEREDRPTALAAANDLMALGALKAAYTKGIRVPRDLSIVGFDDIDGATFVTPSLTTVRQPKYEIGVEAVHLLTSRLDAEQEYPVRNCVLKTSLIVRESTGPAPPSA